MNQKISSIPVVILCGGLGTRLREETEFRPKPMIEIGDKPILWHIMKIYAYWGFKKFVLCLGYKGEIIKQYFYNYDLINNDFTVRLKHKNQYQIHNYNHQENWEVTLADTGNRTLKGARLKKIQKYINTDIFMVTYGDGVANINIKKLLSFHKNHKKIATLTGVDPTSSFGKLKTKGNKVVSFSEKPKTGSFQVNGGFFVFNRTFFKYLSRREDCDLEIGVLNEIAEKGQLMVYKHRGFWSCMDTQRDVLHLNKLWKNKKAEWKVW